MSETTERLGQLRSMLTSRTDGEGKAKLGYRRNVEAIRAEIARLESVADAESQAPAGE